MWERERDVKDCAWQSCVWQSVVFERDGLTCSVAVAKCHACHAKWRSMSPSPTPAMQTAATTTASTGNEARHQSQPSAVSATPATQDARFCREVPRLPRKVKVPATKSEGRCKLCVRTSCVDKSCVRKLCVSKLCVGSKLCVDKSFVDKWMSCVRKLCVSKLCVGKVCVCVWTSRLWTSYWASCVEGGGGRSGGRSKRWRVQLKTRTPHKDVGKKLIHWYSNVRAVVRLFTNKN